jgi:hypothetical protein
VYEALVNVLSTKFFLRGKYPADFTRINRSKIFKEHESTRAETSFKEVTRQKSCNAI